MSDLSWAQHCARNAIGKAEMGVRKAEAELADARAWLHTVRKDAATVGVSDGWATAGKGCSDLWTTSTFNARRGL